MAPEERKQNTESPQVFRAGSGREYAARQFLISESKDLAPLIESWDSKTVEPLTN